MLLKKQNIAKNSETPAKRAVFLFPMESHIAPLGTSKTMDATLNIALIMLASKMESPNDKRYKVYTAPIMPVCK